MVIQDGWRYPSLIRDVIVRLALVYFTIVFKFIFCSAQVFILSRVKVYFLLCASFYSSVFLSLFSALLKFLFYRVFKFIFCSAQVFILA